MQRSRTQTLLISLLGLLCIIMLGVACGEGSTTTTTTNGSAGSNDNKPIATVVATATNTTVATTQNQSNVTKPTDTPKPAVKPTDTPKSKAEAKVDVTQYHIMKDAIATYIVGELKNNGTASASNIQIAISLLDGSGKTIGSANTLLVRRLIGPGETSPFKAMVDTNTTPKWDKEKIQVQATTGAGFMAPLEGLTTTDVNGVLNKNEFLPSYVLNGQVKNGSQKTATLIMVIGAIYDDKGQLIDASNALTKLNEIEPGATAPFELQFLGQKTEPAKFQTWVEGIGK